MENELPNKHVNADPRQAGFTGFARLSRAGYARRELARLRRGNRRARVL